MTERRTADLEAQIEGQREQLRIAAEVTPPGLLAARARDDDGPPPAGRSLVPPRPPDEQHP